MTEPLPIPALPEQHLPPFPSPQEATKIEGSLLEIASWLSNIRTPGIFDTRAPFTLVPSDLKVLDLESYMPVPSRVRKSVAFIDTPSFVDYFTRYQAAYLPRLFTRKDTYGMEILCIFDFDGPGVTGKVTAEDGTESTRTSLTQPMWNDHKATLRLAYHPDYADLKKSDGVWFTQEEFTLFVEENLHLFIAPDSATMLEIAQELKGHRNVGWQSGKRMANGQTKLEYTEELSGKTSRGDIDIPDALILNTPIFDGYDASEIKAAFRWRFDDGKVKFSYRLLTKLQERVAMEAVKVDIVKSTGIPLYSVSSFDGIVNQAG